MTRIAVNGMISRRGVSGGARSTELLVESLERQAGVSVEVVAPAYSRSGPALLRRLRWLTWDLLAFGWSAPDARLLLAANHFGPLVKRGRPSVVLVHDVIVLDHPELFDRSFRRSAAVALNATARTADVIVAPSEFSRRRIEDRLPVRRRVVTIPYYVEDHWFSGPKEAPRRPAVLMVGATEPHKRHQLAVEAVRLARDLTGRDITLTIIGPQGREEGRVRELIALVDPDGSWTARPSHLRADELQRCYRSATLLLHTALEEGFGFPLVEAAATGTPIVHTGGGSMAEVLGAAAPHCPDSVGDVAAAVADVVTTDDYSSRSRAVYDHASARYRQGVHGRRWFELLDTIGAASAR